MDCLYLDHNATTPLLPAVAEAMRPYLDGFAGNASSAHRLGRRARQALEDARERIAALLGAQADEVVFTSGATEANNLAILGLAGEAPGHLIASSIEHPSVAEPLRHLAAGGFTVDYLPVRRDGVVEVGALRDLLRAETRVVALMLVNHETGAIQPGASAIAALAPLAPVLRGEGPGVRGSSEACDPPPHPNPSLPEYRGRGERALSFHCDATQGAGKIPIDFHALGATTLSLSAHKLHGPTGIGALLVRRGTKLPPLLRGGHQQRGLRPGTEPVALAVGFAAALGLAHQERDARHAHLTHLRQLLLDHLREHACPIVVNGPIDALPTTLNVSFPGLAADVLLMALDLAGVACSTGSACSSGSLLPSPTLQAMGVPDDVLRSAMRFSLGVTLSEADVREASRRISCTVNRLRQP